METLDEMPSSTYKSETIIIERAGLNPIEIDSITTSTQSKSMSKKNRRNAQAKKATNPMTSARLSSDDNDNKKVQFGRMASKPNGDVESGQEANDDESGETGNSWMAKLKEKNCWLTIIIVVLAILCIVVVSLLIANSVGKGKKAAAATTVEGKNTIVEFRFPDVKYDELITDEAAMQAYLKKCTGLFKTNGHEITCDKTTKGSLIIKTSSLYAYDDHIEKAKEIFKNADLGHSNKFYVHNITKHLQDKIKELEEEKTTEIQPMEKHIDMLNYDVNERNAEIERMKETEKELHEDAKKLRQMFTDQDEKLGGMIDRMKENEKELHKDAKKVRQMLTDQDEKLRDIIDMKVAEIRKKDATIQEKDSQIQGQLKTIRKHAGLIRVKDAEIEKQEKELFNVYGDAEDLMTQLEEKDSEIENWKQMLKTAEKKVEDYVYRQILKEKNLQENNDEGEWKTIRKKQDKGIGYANKNAKTITEELMGTGAAPVVEKKTVEDPVDVDEDDSDYSRDQQRNASDYKKKHDRDGHDDNSDQRRHDNKVPFGVSYNKSKTVNEKQNLNNTVHKQKNANEKKGSSNRVEHTSNQTNNVQGTSIKSGLYNKRKHLDNSKKNSPNYMYNEFFNKY